MRILLAAIAPIWIFPVAYVVLNSVRADGYTSVLVLVGSVVIALPTLIVFFVLQKQFVAGLTLGATKG